MTSHRPLAALLLAATVMTGSAHAQTLPSAADGDPRLSGIIVTPDRRCAIFAFDRDGISVIADEGTTVGSWTVIGITEHAVEVATATGRQLVSPDAMSDPDQRAPILAAAGQPPTGDAIFNVRTP